jgi:hypothetical protein
VVQLDPEDLEYLGRDHDGSRYWSGRKIEMVKRLGKFERRLAIMAAIFAIPAAIATVLSGLNDGTEWLCKPIGWHAACGKGVPDMDKPQDRAQPSLTPTR